MNQPTNVFTIKDDEGNKIVSTHQGAFVNVRLKLNEENFYRNIGTIKISEREFYVKRDRTKHFMWRTRQYGFNHYILENAKLFDTVVIEDEHARWRIPRETMLQQGKFMHFKNHGGFELQVFVSLDTLAPYEIPKTV